MGNTDTTEQQMKYYFVSFAYVTDGVNRAFGNAYIKSPVFIRSEVEDYLKGTGFDKVIIISKQEVSKEEYEAN